MDVQDVIAVAIAVATGVWLTWSLWRRLQKPSCGPPPNVPRGADGFIAVDALRTVAKKEAGRPEGRPDR